MLFEPTTKIDTQEMIARLAPALAGGRLTEALQIVQANWTVPQLITLLNPKAKPSLPSDVRKLAAAALGLVGDRCAVTPLAVALHDADPMITQMAEHALWSIWFRLGKPAAVCMLKRGSCHLNHGNFDHAAEKFTEALHADPTFAEAYNQRALAYYLAERYPEAQQDCQAAMALMPQHFGAMSGMGHSHAHLKHWAEARHCYRLALAIHPRLEGIQTALRQIDEILAANGSSPTATSDPPPQD